MVRCAAVAALFVLLSGCAVDYTIVSPPGGRPAAIVDVPPDAAVDNLWFSPDGDRLICAGYSLQGNRVSVIDVETGAVVHETSGWVIAVVDGLLVTWRSPDTVAVYDVAWRRTRCLWTRQHPPYCGPGQMAVLPGGKHIRIGGTVRNLRTGEAVSTCEPNAVVSADLASYVTLASRPRKNGPSFLDVTLKDAAAGEAKWACVFQTPRPAIFKAATFDAAGETLLVRAQWHRPVPPGYRGKWPACVPRPANQFWVIDVATGGVIRSGIAQARFTADRKALLARTGSGEGLCLLSLPGGEELVRFSGHRSVVSSVSGVVAGTTGVESGSSPARQRIEFFDSETGRRLGQAKLPGERGWNCELLSDNGRFALLRDGSGLRRCVIAVATGECLLDLRGDIGRRNVFTFSFARRAAFAAHRGRFVANVQKKLLVFNLVP